MSKNDIRGVWRTIGGRRVFIKEGQSLDDAMRESGKFKKKKNDKEKRIKELEEELKNTKGIMQRGKIQEEIDALKEGYDDVGKYRKVQNEKREKALKQHEKEKEERLKIKKQQQKEEEDRGYKMAHRPSKGATLDDITVFNNNEDDDYSPAMPKDFYEHPEYYGNMREKSYQESFEAIKKARNNPDGMVTIYRATTGDTINEGDWITLSKTYAEHHKESWLEGKGKVITLKVKISDVRFAGDDFNEFGYFPKKKKKK